MDIDTSTSRRALLSGALGVGGLAALAPHAAAAAPVPSDPNSAFFLDVDGIPGDATTAKYEGQIELLTWAFGVKSSVDPLATTRGAAPGKSKPADFVLVARAGKASPKLFGLVCTGRRVRNAVLSVVRYGEMPFEYLSVRLDDLRVTSYDVAPNESDGYPLDVVHLEYAKVTYSYTEQKDGSVGGTTTYGYDFGANKPI